MYQGLDEEQKEALREVTRMGFPPAAWFDYKTLGEGAFPILFNLVRAQDPTYFKSDFWNVPGYAGANPSRALQQARVQLKTKVTKVISTGDANQPAGARGGVDTAWNQFQAQAPVVFEVENVPAKALSDAFLLILSGDGAGKVGPLPW